uniref:NlpC/P60 domain-containing protein n=1 Tax=Myotis lucifugus TaxID=59463 RepID=G1Q6V2_MYOLU
LKFFLSEAFLGQPLETVELEGREPEPGDLFLFRLMAPTGRWCGAHVGLYCGHGEIVHFEGAVAWTRTRLPTTLRAATACTLR